MLVSTVKLSAAILLIALSPARLARAADDAPKEDKKREQIGEVLGRPLYRDEIRTDSLSSTNSDLGDKVTHPVMNAYLQAQKEALAPTPEEIEVANAHFKAVALKQIEDEIPKLTADLESIREQLKSTDLDEKEKRRLTSKERDISRKLDPDVTSTSEFVLGLWKFDRHLYEKFGGGRVIRTPFGAQAVDARRAWLAAQEKEGRFKITDPKLRKIFEEQWLNPQDSKSQPQGSSDPEDVRKWLLEPEWAPKKNSASRAS
jgi:hypothetical protein